MMQLLTDLLATPISQLSAGCRIGDGGGIPRRPRRTLFIKRTRKIELATCHGARKTGH
jgi:hypothetical protein